MDAPYWIQSNGNLKANPELSPELTLFCLCTMCIIKIIRKIFYLKTVFSYTGYKTLLNLMSTLHND